MEAVEKVKVLQAMYAGALADAVLRMGREGVLGKVEQDKRDELKLTGAARAKQLGIESVEDVIPKLTDLMGCANWTMTATEDGSGYTAVATRCMLCAMAKKLGAPSPCRIYCLDPMEGMMKGVDGTIQFFADSTLWDDQECKIEFNRQVRIAQQVNQSAALPNIAQKGIATMKEWIKRHNLLSYFLLAFIWSWGWWAGLIFTTPPDAILSGNLPPTFILFALLGGIGPSLSGIIISLLSGGKRTAASTLSGMKKTRLGIGLYAAAILAVPAITLAQAGLQAATGRAVTYNVPGSMLVLGFIWPLFSSFGEEIGWRGYALPRMQKKHGTVSAGLLLGLIWGLWHLPSDYIAYSSYGMLFIPMFLLIGLATLTAHSVIMTAIYNKTHGSLITMLLYHYTITMAGILSPSFSFSGRADDIAKTAVSVAVICIAALLVILFSKSMLNTKQEPLLSSAQHGEGR